MESSPIGQIRIEAIRTAFPKEASHLTTWLEQHVDVLCERLGIQLTVEQREAKVGSFNVDLLCEDENGHPAVIENHISPGTNHWISTGVGRSGISLSYLILKDQGGLELYIDCDSDMASPSTSSRPRP